MTVTNFPSKIAALQFEWAWQHPFKTRHINNAERGEPASEKGFSPKSARSCIPFLFMLLRDRAFVRWPLHVAFFAEDAYKDWQRYVASSGASLPPWLSARLASDDARLETRPRKSKKNPAPRPPAGGEDQPDESQPSLEQLNVSFMPLKAQIEISLESLRASKLNCALCTARLVKDTDRILTCSHGGCTMTSHMHCLATRFLRSNENTEALLPIRGTCPKCCGELHWSDLVKNLSLRMRGGTQLQRLLRKPRAKKAVNQMQDVHSEREGDDEPSDNDEGFPDIDEVEACADERSQMAVMKKSALKEISKRGRANPAADVRTIVENSDPDDIDAVSE